MADVSATLPSLLREELYHPAIVHFPIAFLAVAGGVAAFWFLTKKGAGYLLLLLTIGVIGGWLGILTGGWAEDVVNRVICDPTVTSQHEQWAEWAVWAASVALPAVFLAAVRKVTAQSLLFRFSVTSLILFSSGSVLYAGHLGASLVYLQGAAVYKPSPQCTEFE